MKNELIFSYENQKKNIWGAILVLPYIYMSSLNQKATILQKIYNFYIHLPLLSSLFETKKNYLLRMS